jgi:hypothetical protein
VTSVRRTTDHGPRHAFDAFEAIFSRYATASAIGIATIPQRDEGGLSLAAVNRMIAAGVRGVKAREARRDRAR